MDQRERVTLSDRDPKHKIKTRMEKECGELAGIYHGAMSRYRCLGAPARSPVMATKTGALSSAPIGWPALPPQAQLRHGREQGLHCLRLLCESACQTAVIRCRRFGERSGLRSNGGGAAETP